MTRAEPVDAADAGLRIAQALEVGGIPHALDRAYVRRWIVDMMGEADDRVSAWDELCARFGSPPE